MNENEGKLIDDIMQNALEAFDKYNKAQKDLRASFLNEIAIQIELHREKLVPVAMEESHLPEGRLQGELSRTVNQLKMFADLVQEGSWVEAAIDNGNPQRKPMPKPDTRKMLCPVGPVIIFGASNFPFAFSTAGGDTASALASGSTVVIKGHPAHTHTSEMIFEAMKIAQQVAHMPEHTIQHISNGSFTVGKDLVQHPITAGVGFTGSFKGGRALMDYASARKTPIPVYAEMGSVNPVVFYPECLAQNATELAKKLSASITLGMGQFCTNPGLILAIDGPGLHQFIDGLKAGIEAAVPQDMLHQGIHDNYCQAVKKIRDKKDIEIIATASQLSTGIQATPLVGKINADTFLENEYLQEEVFGPYSLLVICKNIGELKDVLTQIDGQLTTTLMATENDMSVHQDIFRVQQKIAGRILVNDVPTGVEVCSSMIHGGPYPSTSDGRSTSVGTTAIRRWVRPICYQGFPQQFLPDELKDANPYKIWRLVDNEWKK